MLAFLEWFYANVFGNLVASAIAGTAVWLWARRHINLLHNHLKQVHAAAIAARLELKKMKEGQ